MPSRFITNTAEGFTLWDPGLQIKCQIQFATENMKWVTALRGATWQQNFIIGVCPNDGLKYKKKCYLTAVILKINNPPLDRLKYIRLKFEPLVKFAGFI